MVQSALGEGVFELVFLSRSAHLVVHLDVHHMSEDGPAVGFEELCRISSQAKFVGDRRSKARRVDEVLCRELLSLMGRNRHLIAGNLKIDDFRLLSGFCPILNRYGEQVGVGVLAEEMAVWPQRRRQSRVLVRFFRVLLLPLTLIEKAKGTLHSAGGTDVIAELVKGAEVGDFGDVVFRRQDLESKTCVGSCSLANSEPRVLRGIDHQHSDAVPRENGSEQPAADASSKNNNALVIFGCHVSPSQSPFGQGKE